MYNHNQSELMTAIIEAGCVVGKDEGCLYHDQNSLAQGNMSLAAKTKLLKAKYLAKAKAMKIAKAKAAAKLAK